MREVTEDLLRMIEQTPARGTDLPGARAALGAEFLDDLVATVRSIRAELVSARKDDPILAAVAAGEMSEGCAMKILGLDRFDLRARVNFMLAEAKARESAFFGEKGDSEETPGDVNNLANLSAANANLQAEVRRLNAPQTQASEGSKTMASEMIFHHEDGRVMTRDEVIAAGMGHLLPDAPAWRCSSCNRKTTAARDKGKTCGMIQPDGSRCPGRFN